MGKYVLKRLLYVVVVFLVASVLIFGIYKLVPGDPALLMLEGSKQSMKPEAYQAAYDLAREKLGLDYPIPVQYFRWIGNMLVGDFGYSLQYKQPVKDVVGTFMRNTVILNVASFLPIFLITIPLGIFTAVRKGSKFDTGVQIVTIVGYSLPLFVIALMFIFIFAVKLGWFPINGSYTIGFEGTPLQMMLDRGYHIILPVITIVFSSLGGLTRYVRAAMIESLRMDCIRTARAKGLREKTVIYVHAFRNAMIPFITVVTSWVVSVFSGSVVIEQTFLWNGMGSATIQALRQQDFSMSMAILMFYLLLALVGNLIMDLLYGVADPRVKLA